MSTLLYSLGRWSYRHSWQVLVAWIVLLGIAGGGALAFMKGTDDSFSIPGTEAQEGIALLNRTFPEASGTSAQYIVVAAPGDTVDQAPYTTDIADAIEQLDALDGVLAITDPFDAGVSGMVSDDASAAILRLQFEGELTEVPASTKDALADVAADLRDTLPEGARVALGGEMFAASVPAISATEAIGVILALFVLMVTFRSLAMSFFPLISAIIGVGLTIGLIMISTAFATVSATTPMLALMLGLAVGIDYALFIVARHQDQVRAGVAPEESAARATATAGSAVVFAGVTVLIALIGLSFANIPFLTTMGIAAAGGVAIAVVVALTLTPALLGFVKHRVVGWRTGVLRLGVGRRGAKRTDAAAAPSAGPARTARPPRPNRWVMLVTRHPLVTTVAVIVGLGVAAIPAASLSLALPNAGVQPETSEARQAYDLTAEHFGAGFNGPLIMTGTIVTSTDPLGLMADLKAEVEKVPGVKEVALATPNLTGDTGLIQIVPETGPADPATADLVRALRGEHDRLLDEFGVDLKVTGFTAVGIDISDKLGGALLPFGVFVIGLSLVLLTIVFRSIWVPIKAALGYLLSVGASFGAVAAVFEWGWFADALHIARVGPVISFMPIILMGVLFGLAMDYEVFLVSRMREDYVHLSRARSGRADRATAISAVRSGFTASARVVTAAAVIMFAVFAAFVPEGDSSIKPIALGLAVGIAVDAFIVRMTLVPAVMALLGEKAWWMPRWLDRILPRFDIEGEAIERELTLASWPEPDTTAAAVGDDVSIVADAGRRRGEVTLFSDASFRVEPGGSLIATGDPRSTRAFLLALAGRIAPTGGRLRVAGHLLPGRAAWVRSHVGVALLEGAADPAGELRRALRGASIAVVDGLDTLDAAARDQAAAVIRDAARRAEDRRSGPRPLTLALSTRDEHAARVFLADAHRTDVSALALQTRPTPLIGASAPAAAMTSEVTA